MEENKIHTWEEAVKAIYAQEKYRQYMYDAYLTPHLIENCQRFSSGEEFVEVLNIIQQNAPNAKKILDLAAGNGIASYAFAKKGYSVVALEPDPSNLVGKGAIEYIKEKEELQNLSVVSSYGESMPFSDGEFDVVYVRQGLHHANDLKQMLREIGRVLKHGGLFIATRENVVDDYGKSLQKFRKSHPIDQLYAGENAFLLKDYIRAIEGGSLKIIRIIPPYETQINLYPINREILQNLVLNSRPGKWLQKCLPKNWVWKLGFWALKYKKIPGRLYSFIACRVVL